MVNRKEEQKTVIIRQLVDEYNKMVDMNRKIQKIQHKNVNTNRECNENIMKISELVIVREIYDSIQF
jgi:dsDNA-binding SOS-regulon protein